MRGDAGEARRGAWVGALIALLWGEVAWAQEQAPVSPPGPALVAVGNGSLVAGAIIGSVAMATTECHDLGGCADRRRDFLLAGLSLVGLGATMEGVGVGLWARDIAPEEGTATREGNVPVAVSGATLTALGTAGIVAGVSVSVWGSCDEARAADCEYGHPGVPVAARAALFAGGVAALGIGLPLWVIGGQRVAAAPGVALRTEGAGLALAGHW